jgi:hypothetical protein
LLLCEDERGSRNSDPPEEISLLSVRGFPARLCFFGDRAANRGNAGKGVKRMEANEPKKKVRLSP